MPSLELAKNKEQTIKKTEEYYNALRTNIQLSGDNIKVIAVIFVLLSCAGLSTCI